MTLIAYFRDEIFINRKVGFVFRRGGGIMPGEACDQDSTVYDKMSNIFVQTATLTSIHPEE